MIRNVLVLVAALLTELSILVCFLHLGSLLAQTSPIAIMAPSGTLSGTVQVTASINGITVAPSGSWLIVDGVKTDCCVPSPPWVYALDTTKLTDGPHTLQVAANDSGNNTDLSPAVTVTVANGPAPVPPVTPPSTGAVVCAAGVPCVPMDSGETYIVTASATGSVGTFNLTIDGFTMVCNFPPTETPSGEFFTGCKVP